MACAMRVQPFFAEIGGFPASKAETSGKDVANTESGQRLTAMIQKNPSFRSQVQIPFFAESSQDRRGLRPQRAVAFFPTLAKHRAILVHPAGRPTGHQNRQGLGELPIKPATQTTAIEQPSHEITGFQPPN